MDPDVLLDYALGQLDRTRREELEKLIRRDPELTERVARLIRNPLLLPAEAAALGLPFSATLGENRERTSAVVKTI